MACPPPGSSRRGPGATRPGGPGEPLRPERESREPPQPESEPREPLRLETEFREPRCAMCGGPWRDLGHCKGVCLRCGFMQSCVDTI